MSSVKSPQVSGQVAATLMTTPLASHASVTVTQINGTIDQTLCQFKIYGEVYWATAVTMNNPSNILENTVGNGHVNFLGKNQATEKEPACQVTWRSISGNQYTIFFTGTIVGEEGPLSFYDLNIGTFDKV